jgi:peptide/nickel transport system substrate-binding protein
MKTAMYAGAASAVGVHPGISFAVSGDTLNVRTFGTLSGLDPAYAVGGVPGYAINWATIPALVHYDYDANGDLIWSRTAYVERFTVRDDTHIDFTLTKGLMWSGGNGEFTTSDVQYSYDRMKTGHYAGNFVAYDRVEIKDKYNATIVLKHAFAPFIIATLCEGVGTIVCAKAVEAVGGTFTTEMPATCGPYLSEWEPRQFVKLTPNPEWTGRKPAFANVNFIFITEMNAAALAFEAGEVDCTLIAPSTYERYLRAMPANSSLTIAGALQAMFVGMNQDHPKLQDIRVRKAIQRAIDVDTVIQGAYGGAAEKAHGIVPPGVLGKRDAAKYSYDPMEARALLNEAGITGLELTIRTLNTSERMLAATIIQANLQAIGIKASILPQDVGAYWEMGHEDKGDGWQDLELYISNWGVGADPFDGMQWFVSDMVGIWNWERWTDEEYDALYAEGLLATDPEKRGGIYLRMQEIMEDTGCYAWLLHEPEVYVHRDNLRPHLAPTGESQVAYFRPA